jgi:hypothetical protein
MVSNWCWVGSWARALPFQVEEGVWRSSWDWGWFAVVFVFVVVVVVSVRRSVPLPSPIPIPSYPCPCWNSSSVKAGRATPGVDVSCSRKACAADVDPDPDAEPGPPCGVVADRSLLVCVFGRVAGPACLLLVLDARVWARSGLGLNALFARPVAEFWMRVASEGGAGLGGGWLEGLFEVEGDGVGAGVLELWLEVGLPRMFSSLVMAWVGFGIRG